jgi:VCBS repeat-containing protein
MDAPVAVDDTVNVEMDVTSDIDVLANDTDADDPFQPQVLTLTGITSPTSGTASIVANQIRYTPNALYLGSDTIEYVIQDQDGNISNTGTVSITVSTTNQPPTTQSGSYTLDEDTSITQTLSGSDPDMTDVTFVLDTDVTRGTLTLSSTGIFTYVPDADYHGTDSFTFHVTDGIFDSAIETVTFTIVSVNDAPVAVDDSFTVNEDTFIDITPMQNDSDVDVGDTFSLNSVSTPLHGSAVITGSLIRYTPVADYCGEDTFEYTIIDQSGATSAP